MATTAAMIAAATIAATIAVTTAAIITIAATTKIDEEAEKPENLLKKGSRTFHQIPKSY